MNRFLLLVVLFVGATLASTIAASQATNTAGPTITSPTHPAGVPVNASIADFSWTAVTLDAAPQYVYTLTANETSEPGAADNSTSALTATVIVPPFGISYFHVVATTPTQRTLTSHYGPVSRSLGLSQLCAGAFGGDSEDPDTAASAKEDCITATQGKVLPQAILGAFMVFLAKFGSAAMKRG